MAIRHRAHPGTGPELLGLAVAELGRTRLRLRRFAKTAVTGALLCLLCFVSRAADFDPISYDDIAFVRIPAGTFWMGTSEADKAALVKEKAWSQFEDCELPAHPVTISHPFLISKYEITQQQWKAVMGKNPAAFKGDNLPIESVSWSDVQQFIAKLKERSHATYRLPTEAEWEYCARAESTNLFGYACHYEPISQRNLGCFAWYRADADNHTHPVGQKKPNLWGLYDMAGNVWEWCQDWYAPDYYARSTAQDPVNTQPAVERVFRGGSWFLDWRNVRAAYRSGSLPELKSQYVGFRLVREIEAAP